MYVGLCVSIHICMYTHVYIHIYKFKLKMICKANEGHLYFLSIGALTSNLTLNFFYTLQTDFLDLCIIEGSVPAINPMRTWNHRKEIYKYLSYRKLLIEICHNVRGEESIQCEWVGRETPRKNINRKGWYWLLIVQANLSLIFFLDT